jgi:hypothetical protein
MEGYEETTDIDANRNHARIEHTAAWDGMNSSMSRSCKRNSEQSQWWIRQN